MHVTRDSQAALIQVVPEPKAGLFGWKTLLSGRNILQLHKLTVVRLEI